VSANLSRVFYSNQTKMPFTYQLMQTCWRVMRQIPH